MDLELRDKVAIVTGGNRGIGKAIAWQLAKEGVDVALIARDRAALETAATEIARATNRGVKGFVADTGDDAAVKTGVAQALGEFGRVDILVNCAAAVGGQGKPPTLAEIANEPFFADMNVKVLGYLRTIREVAPHMAAQGGGRIINISGLAALHTGSTIGSIRNVGVAALTKNLADDLRRPESRWSAYTRVVRAPKRPTSSSNGKPGRRASPLMRSNVGWPEPISHSE